MWGSCKYKHFQVKTNLLNSKAFSRDCRANLLQRTTGAKVKWDQDKYELFIKVPVSSDTRASDVSFSVRPSLLSLKVKGEQLLSGSIQDAGEVVQDGCYFNMMNEDVDGQDQRYIQIVLEKKESGWYNWEKLLVEDDLDLSYTRYCWIRVSSDGKDIGRILMGMFGNVVPKTVENFRQLCTGQAVSKRDGRQLSYKGSKFFKILPNSQVIGGDLDNKEGHGGESIYGDEFPDETRLVRNIEKGDIGMYKVEGKQNSSAFYFNMQIDNLALDYKGVVFGRVVAGMHTLNQIHKNASVDGKPLADMEIIDGGDLHVDDIDRFKNDMFLEEKSMFGSTLQVEQINPNLSSFVNMPNTEMSSEMQAEMEKQGLFKLLEEKQQRREAMKKAEELKQNKSDNSDQEGEAEGEESMIM